ncbi:MAG TPA: type VI secretion system protein TssA [Ideonella sp.]|uniref:type VI secretion system protein TssA n=1 Tax=Ideonella sp. TaxID=1929293 RepID=UPI002BD57B9A|nr:type VI secretion system protein TssA [Ideonella sp.]HSI49065.1 type VI secretion system protein TssA [Ideonella sp.]
MADLDLDSLLAPLQHDAPCGADLEYDPVFLALQTAGAGRPEQQYGDTLIAAEEPDWPKVRELALSLAARTRDLRVAVWLLRSGARLQGWHGALQGLQLLQGLLSQHWAQVHPQLDASDGNDPTARLNALQPLVSPAEVLADLRAASLTGQRGGPRVREAELAAGLAEAAPGEAVPSPQGLQDALAKHATAVPALAQHLGAGLPVVQGIAAAIEQQLGATHGPDFAPLLRLLKPLAALGAQLQGVPASQVVAVAGDGAAGPVAAAAPAASGVIASREDAMRALQRACEWIERNEPSHPAPLLIRRGMRLMSKNFMDIVRDLVPDGVRELEKLAGASSD